MQNLRALTAREREFVQYGGAWAFYGGITAMAITRSGYGSGAFFGGVTCLTSFVVQRLIAWKTESPLDPRGSTARFIEGASLVNGVLMMAFFGKGVSITAIAKIAMGIFLLNELYKYKFSTEAQRQSTAFKDLQWTQAYSFSGAVSVVALQHFALLSPRLTPLQGAVLMGTALLTQRIVKDRYNDGNIRSWSIGLLTGAAACHASGMPIPVASAALIVAVVRQWRLTTSALFRWSGGQSFMGRAGILAKQTKDNFAATLLPLLAMRCITVLR